LAPWLNDEEYLIQFSRKMGQFRVPLCGTLDLTNRCNLRCVHCYLADSREVAELRVAAWRRILDQLERAGCLFLTLTGGEPLLHRDFAEVYVAARRRGMLVSVFTNGTLVDDAVVELFREWPPHVVEVSVYGYSRAVYGAVTGRPEARATCFAGIRRLHRAGVPLRLKTMALRQNRREIARLARFSRGLGVPFRFDPHVTPTLRGSPSPGRARLRPAQALRLDTGDPKRLAAWSKVPPVATRTTLFYCGGGRTSFFVDPAGRLALCVLDEPIHDLTKATFAAGWEGPIRRRRERGVPDDYGCRACRDRAYCQVCPALARLTTGSELGVPRRECRLGHAVAGAVRGRGDRLAVGAPDGV
jgi:MoaA/NifB/PqqE/SkfB family radical SAM enzyme